MSSTSLTVVLVVESSLLQYVNHYFGLDWDELSDYGVLDSVRALGWTQDSWDNDRNPPKSEDKFWDELSDDEKEAADDLCFFAETWDQTDLNDWEGTAWPESRYWTWDGLDSSEQKLMQVAGYSKDTWNNPGKASFESLSWEELGETQQEALLEYGFYEAQWNCFMTHYEDYDWFELVLEEVAEYFETLGWTEATWQSGEEPWAWNADWNELSESQQDAAWEICYFRELWDEVPLPDWPDSTVSGGPMNKPSRLQSSDSGGRPGVWIFLMILFLCACIGFYFCKRRKDGKEVFDPTAPTKAGPSAADLSMETNSNDNSLESDEDGGLQDIPTIT